MSTLLAIANFTSESCRNHLKTIKIQSH